MSVLLDMSDEQTRSRVEALGRVAADAGMPDTDLANCCCFLLGTPTFAGIVGDYARKTVAAALEAQGRESRLGAMLVRQATDPGATATGSIEPGTTTGEEGEIEGSSGQDAG